MTISPLHRPPPPSPFSDSLSDCLSDSLSDSLSPVDCYDGNVLVFDIRNKVIHWA